MRAQLTTFNSVLFHFSMTCVFFFSPSSLPPSKKHTLTTPHLIPGSNRCNEALRFQLMQLAGRVPAQLLRCQPEFKVHTRRRKPSGGWGRAAWGQMGYLGKEDMQRSTFLRVARPNWGWGGLKVSFCRLHGNLESAPSSSREARGALPHHLCR